MLAPAERVIQSSVSPLTHQKMSSPQWRDHVIVLKTLTQKLRLTKGCPDAGLQRSFSAFESTPSMDGLFREPKHECMNGEARHCPGHDGL
jgi:hypothetical protein